MLPHGLTEEQNAKLFKPFRHLEEYDRVVQTETGELLLIEYIPVTAEENEAIKGRLYEINLAVATRCAREDGETGV